MCEITCVSAIEGGANSQISPELIGGSDPTQTIDAFNTPGIVEFVLNVVAMLEALTFPRAGYHKSFCRPNTL